MMSALPISSSPTPAASLPKQTASPADRSAQSFSEFLGSAQAANESIASESRERRATRRDQPAMEAKGSLRQASPELEPASKDKKQPAANSTAALALLLPVPQPHEPPDTRTLSIGLPRKEQESDKASAAGAAVDKAEQASTAPQAGLAGMAPHIISKQQIAFGATLSKIASSGPQQAQQADKLVPVDGKSDSGKKHSGSSDAERERSSSRDAHTEGVAAKSDSSAPAQFYAAAAPAAGPSSGPSSVQAAATTHVPAAYTMQPVAKTSPAAPIRSAEITEAPASPVSRSQSIDLQAGDVNVRVSQRAGDVQITVRTPDIEMAQSLRQHLPELADKLTQASVHADLWQPSAAQSASADGGADSSPGRDAQSQQQSGTGTSDDRPNTQQQRDEQKRQHNAWQQEFSSADGNDR
jgi:hypothetical protein